MAKRYLDPYLLKLLATDPERYISDDEDLSNYVQVDQLKVGDVGVLDVYIDKQCVAVAFRPVV